MKIQDASGPIPALLAEYEKAILKLSQYVAHQPEIYFQQKIVGSKRFDNIQTVLKHVVGSGYIYANYIRQRFGVATIPYSIEVVDFKNAIEELQKMYLYSLETCNDKLHLTDEDLMQTIIKTSWTTYDLEALLEHAIMHILRHLSQIQSIINTFETQNI